jgi:hypothetical protein
MFSSTLYYQKPNKGRASSLFSKYLNTGTLALVMLVALVLFATIRDNKSETKDSTPGKSTKSEVVTDKLQDNTSYTITEAARQKTFPPLIAWQFVNRMISTFKDAFNDPSIIAYANEQEADLPDSLTASLPNTSGQPPAPAKSLSTQSTRSP